MEHSNKNPELSTRISIVYSHCNEFNAMDVIIYIISCQDNNNLIDYKQEIIDSECSECEMIYWR